VGEGEREDEADARERERQERIADACLTLDGDAPGRLGVYRRLVQTNLCAVARRLLPRTAATLDASAGTGFADWFARFLADQGPRTPYLRDIPAELVAWAGPLWSEDRTLPPSLSDVARFEVDRFRVESSPRVAARACVDVGLDRPLVFAAPHALAQYAFAVTEEAAPPRATDVLLFRDPDNEVHALVIDPRRAPFLSALLARAPLGDALRQAGPPDLDVPALARWLADLAAAGALLGAEG
jgi:hypothetical protein